MAKNSGPNPRSFPKNVYLLPPRGAKLGPQNENLFTPRPTFRLHAVSVTAGSGYRDFGYFLRDFHVLNEIYPAILFPALRTSPRFSLGFSVDCPILLGPLTAARARGLVAHFYAIYSVFEARTFSPVSLLDGYWMHTDPSGGQTGPSAVKHCSPSIV